MSEKVELLILSDFVLGIFKKLGIGYKDYEDKSAFYTLKSDGIVIDRVEALHWGDAKRIFEKKGLNLEKYFEPIEYEMYWNGANWVIEDLEVDWKFAT